MKSANPVLENLAGGVNVRQSYHDFSQGPIEQTSRPLDLAILGEGFFVVGDGTDDAEMVNVSDVVEQAIDDSRHLLNTKPVSVHTDFRSDLKLTLVPHPLLRASVILPAVTSP